jgi:hypothetical protein
MIMTILADIAEFEPDPIESVLAPDGKWLRSVAYALDGRESLLRTSMNRPNVSFWKANLSGKSPQFLMSTGYHLWLTAMGD